MLIFYEVYYIMIILNEVCKVKGLTLNASTDGKVNYDSIKSLILDKDKILTHTCKTIRRTAQHSVVTREETKSYKATSMKRKFTSKNTSCPYGFKILELNNYIIINNTINMM